MKRREISARLVDVSVGELMKLRRDYYILGAVLSCSRAYQVRKAIIYLERFSHFYIDTCSL